MTKDGAMPWVKFYTDFINDPKTGMLPDTAQLVFVKLVLLAGECDADGYIVDGEVPLNDSNIAWKLRKTITETQEALASLQNVGVVSKDGDAWVVTNFSKRQGRAQSEKRAQWRAHQAVRREKVRKSVFDRAGGKCEYCGRSIGSDSFIVEHVVPPFKGGSHTSMDNLACACQSCNAKKGDKTPEEMGWHNPRVINDSAEVINDSAEVSVTEGEEEKEERKTKKSPKQASEPRPRNLLFDAVAEVTASNVALLGGRIAKCATGLQKIGATPEQVRQVAAWYQANDWRGRKGEKLTFATLIEVWESGIRGAPAPAPSSGKGQLNEPASFAAIREAMQDPRYKGGK